MVTVSEDYVSHKTAKLLEGKFHSEDCFAFYKENGDIGFLQTFGDIAEYDPETCVHAPTLQMAMKVLREMGIAIIPIISSILDEEKFLWDAEIVTTKNKVYRQGWVYEHLEEVIDTAIRWSLENLI